MAVFAGGQFPAYAEALGSETLFFPRKKFIELITKDPSMAMDMLYHAFKTPKVFYAARGKPFPQGSAPEACCISSCA